MSAAQTPIKPAAPAALFDTADGNQRVVVVAMKTQLRGRIRRSVTTLLEEGAEVTVLGLKSDKDFTVGLDHERLTVELLNPSSAHTWLVRRQQSSAANRKRRTQQMEQRRELRAVTGVARTTRWKVRKRRRRAEGRKKRMLALRRWVLPLHRITRWADFWRISRTRTIHHRPHFVVSSDLPGLVGASLAAKTLGVHHVHDCHELYLESTNLKPLERMLLAPLERRYMRRADAVVMVNESIRAEYAERYAVDGVVIRNCAETGDMQAGQDLYELAGVSSDAHLVLYQGGFSVGRGLETVIAAVAEFPERAHLVMMGYGPMELSLCELAESQGVSDRVTFIEAVPPQQLLSTTATATIGLVPYQPVSTNNRLALPNKIFEYTTVGLPVVVSDIPELARIANEGAGLTYDSFDPSDLARAVSEILAPGDIEAAEASSRSWGRSNTWEIEQRKLVNVWRNALKT